MRKILVILFLSGFLSSPLSFSQDGYYLTDASYGNLFIGMYLKIRYGSLQKDGTVKFQPEDYYNAETFYLDEDSTIQGIVFAERCVCIIESYDIIYIEFDKDRNGAYVTYDPIFNYRGEYYNMPKELSRHLRRKRKYLLKKYIPQNRRYYKQMFLKDASSDQ